MRLFLLFTISVALQLIGASPLSAIGPTTPQPSDAKALGKELMNNLPGIFSLDQEHKEHLGGYQVPPIKNGNWVLKARPVSLVESFAQQTGAVTTLFVKVDSEFVRLYTTETNEKAGTILSHESPAYRKMNGELRYTGTITLAGKDYMADYDVFRDRQGRVIGAYLVGIPLSQ